MIKQYISLSSKVVAYVPCTIGDRKLTEAEQKPFVNDVAGSMSDWFGGATVVDAVGYWRNPETKELVTENTKQVISFTDTKTLSAKTQNFTQMMEALRKEMNQYSVAFEINNKMYLIEGK